MSHTLISLCLAFLAVLSVVAEAIALHRLLRPGESSGRWVAQGVLVGVIGIVAAGLFVMRWANGQWQPLVSHLDGLLLVAVLFSAVVLYIQMRPKLTGLSAFTLPLLTLVLTWGICAAQWSYHPFALTKLWALVHLGGVYVGTFFAAGAAVGGGMFLYIQGRLKAKQGFAGTGPGHLASLETLEGVIIHTASLGFALLTLGLASGLVIAIDDPGDMGAGWWYSPKMILAVVAWAIYALVMNLRHASRFRGRRAAWLGILGFVLLMAVYAVITGTADIADQTDSPPGSAPTATSTTTN